MLETSFSVACFPERLVTLCTHVLVYQLIHTMENDKQIPLLFPSCRLVIVSGFMPVQRPDLEDGKDRRIGHNLGIGRYE